MKTRLKMVNKMTLDERIDAFVALSQELSITLSGNGEASACWQKLLQAEPIYNAWFVPEFVRFAMERIVDMTARECLEAWILPYRDEITHQKTSQRIGVLMPGNIPLVGFHDFLSVLLTGNIFTGKLSSSDARLLPFLVSILIKIEPRWADMIHFCNDKLSCFDKVIATGSDNTISTLTPYFDQYPSLLRGHCNSIAVLDGSESVASLADLADDMFIYFGLGCRSVSKIYVPLGYDFRLLFEEIDLRYKEILSLHNKYLNNLEYQKTVHLLNRVSFLDQGVSMFKECFDFNSPISVIHYQYYDNKEKLQTDLQQSVGKLQCMFSNVMDGLTFSPLGNAQRPALSDYANEIDTIKFLLNNENSRHRTDQMD